MFATTCFKYRMKNVAQHGLITLSVSTHTRQMRSFDSTEHSRMIVLFLTASASHANPQGASPNTVEKGGDRTWDRILPGCGYSKRESSRIGSDAHLITCSRSTSDDHMTDDGNETLYFVNCAWDIYLSKKFVLHMTFTLFKEKLWQNIKIWRISTSERYV